MGVCYHRKKFMSFFASYPGSCHDAHVLRNSRFWNFMEGGGLNGIILGDCGYPQTRWLYTPVPFPRTPADAAYNVAHRRTRCYVEQSFGILRARFRVLHSECRLQPPKLCKVANACAVLHNMGTDDRIEVEPVEEDEDGNQEPAPEAFVQNINKRADYIARFLQINFAALPI